MRADHDATTLSALAPFRAAGFALHWLYPKSKRPSAGDRWSELPVASLDELRLTHRAGANLGVRLGEPSRLIDGTFLHAIDVDNRIADLADESQSKLAELFPGIDLTAFPTVQSGSGGESRHIYIATSAPLYGRKLAVSEGKHRRIVNGKETWSYDWEIELFGTGKQVAMPPSIHPDTGKPYVWLVPFDLDGLACGINPAYLPLSALEAIGAVETATYAFETRPPLTFEPGQLERDLDAIPVSRIDDREDWITLGQALHHQFGGSDEGFELWMKHSARGSKFLVGSTRAKELRRYRGFGRNRRQPVTMATIRLWATESRQASLVDQFDEEPLPAEDEYESLLGPAGTASREFDQMLNEPVKSRVPDYVRKLNEKHAVVRTGGQAPTATFESDGAISLGTFEHLRHYYANQFYTTQEGKRACIAVGWRDHPARRTYDGLEFSPGGGTPGFLNLWRGWAVEPKPGASCQLFLRHVLDVVCGGRDELFAYAIGWMAHMVQRPDEKPGVALVLKGAKGAGKDTVADYLSRMIGRRHVPTVADKAHVTGRFNARLMQALMLQIQEGLWAGDREAESPLKALVTSEVLEIEKKGIDSFSLRSVLRVFISANAEWVVPASADERRWAVFDVGSSRVGDEAYFTALRAEMEGDGPAALLHFLMTYDLTGFNVRRAPATAGLIEQKIQSLRGVAKWWFDALSRGGLASGERHFNDWEAGEVVVSREWLRGEYSTWLRGRRFEGDEPGAAHFGRHLSPVARGVVDRRGTVAGERFWQYVIPPLGVCRRDFEAYIGGAVAWST